MPKTSSSPASHESSNTDSMALVRARADALFRGAVECCRQHDRAARISAAEEPEIEHGHVDAMCKMCDNSLAELVTAYNAAAATIHPEVDEPWWHRANQLWHASREYARRHAGGESLTKRLAARHNAEQLGSVQMDYELEASSLLALRHAAEAYRKARPDLG